MANKKTFTDESLKTFVDEIKSYTDSAVAEKANKTHSHAISDVTNLQSSLDEKANSVHTHNISQISDLTATADELNYVSGVTSSIQTQLDGKQATVSGGASTITSSNLTARRALVSNGSGKVAVSAVTSSELYYLDGVTSNIQTQLNDKAASSHTHSEYMTTSDPTGTGSFSLNRKNGTTVGTKSVAIGYNVTASGDYSYAEGYGTFATSSSSDTAQRYAGTASGDYTHAEGYGTVAYGTCAHSEGNGTTASGCVSHAEGNNTTASGDFSHAEGSGTTASGDYSHAEGNNTKASGNASHAEGESTTASGTGSHAEGGNTTADNYSHAEGYYTTAKICQHVQGHYNNTSTAAQGGTYGTSGTAFVIGNGTSSSVSNAFRIAYNGTVYSKSTTMTTGADYAEFFEWLDGNPNAEDRRGYFVTLDGDKIKIAKPNDYILGVISGQPSVTGNGDEEWMGRYIMDEFGAFIVEEFEYEEIEHDENGNEINVTKIGTKYKENPDYDPTRPYIQREDRPEWDAVGMLGVLSVRDDGTCKVNGFCKLADGGIATASDTGYRVVKRVTDNIVKIIFK